MAGYVTNIERETLKNRNFRKVLFTGPHHQLVVMSLKPGEEIGKEKHDVDQFFRVEQGRGVVVMNGKSSRVKAESGFVVPAGTEHNVINKGDEDMRLYTIYSSPQHADGVIQKTKAEADAEEHH